MRHLGFVLLLLLLLLLIESEACTFSDDDYHAIEKLQNFTSWADSRAECSRKCTVECCTHPEVDEHWGKPVWICLSTKPKKTAEEDSPWHLAPIGLVDVIAIVFTSLLCLIFISYLVYIGVTYCRKSWRRYRLRRRMGALIEQNRHNEDIEMNMLQHRHLMQRRLVGEGEEERHEVGSVNPFGGRIQNPPRSNEYVLDNEFFLPSDR
ncbi:hypothetical protein PRIPAC_96090 [Pristionchus pacificus]|uniref:Uncharacterized protein n=1 Tax=Pristionchus pacificus TaxID=54126 RepID=A0A2A6BCR9_PRIPA|nr:hypothetical protein PRIPAC_96090 [Pristionchus pacificus]|eukprot:PDM63668.1 hypothetical protein PRIPAC_49641 [Pristionchus pacificus]